MREITKKKQNTKLLTVAQNYNKSCKLIHIPHKYNTVIQSCAKNVLQKVAKTFTKLDQGACPFVQQHATFVNFYDF